MEKLFDKIVFHDFSILKGENAHLIVREFRKHARAQGWDAQQLEKVIDQAMIGDYDHLWDVICLYSKTPNK